MKICAFILLIIFLCVQEAFAAGIPVTEESQGCIECHSQVTPGIVSDWKNSLHAKMTPKMGLKKEKLQRRISAAKVPEALGGRSVSCAECHTMNPEGHKDSFDHNGYEVHIVVTPRDCSSCHPDEARDYNKNLMSHAYGNLKNNSLYRELANSVNGIQRFGDTKTTYRTPDPKSDADSCFSCHGTVVEVNGTETRETEDGEMTFPLLSGWPNQGVGRVNPDGSKGACTSCHTRHRFSIKMARRSYTCSQCHKGPDVPAYKVYQVSKHGNITYAGGDTWNWEAVPWTVGKDFTAPTCATCHVSLLVSEENRLIAGRSHRMNDRLAWRIFGLIYAHAHPKSPDTSVIRNRAGLPLPTELTGEPATKYLIGAEEQEARRGVMKKVCLGCHGRGWVDGHFARFENTLKTTNQMTLTGTKILLSAWEKGAAEKENIFDEGIEKMWVEQWLFFANSTRFSSAMMGADYGAFANGRWYMAKNIQDMLDRLQSKLKEKE